MAEQKSEVQQESVDSLLSARTHALQMLKEHAAISEENATLQQALQDQAATFAQERAGYQAEIQAVTEDRDMLRVRLTAAVSVAEQFKDNADKSANSLLLVQTQMAQLAAERDQLDSMQKEATGWVVKLKATKEGLLEQLKQSQAQIKTLEEDRNKALAYLETVLKSREGLKVELNESRNLNASLQADLDFSRDLNNSIAGHDAEVVIRDSAPLPTAAPTIPAPQGNPVMTQVIAELQQRQRNSAGGDQTAGEQPQDQNNGQLSPRDEVSRKALVRRCNGVFNEVTRVVGENQGLTVIGATSLVVTAAIALKTMF